MFSKDEVRLLQKRNRKMLTPSERETSSVRVLDRIKTLKLIGKNIMIYNSFAEELPTKRIIEYLYSKCAVFLPKVEGNDLSATRLDRNSKFEKGTFGIEEIVGTSSDRNLIDVCIIPCLAVDIEGNRVGFGRGYYDKFLENLDVLKIAICYDFQVVDKVESNQFDVKMQMIITDKRIIVVDEKIRQDNKI